MSAPKPELTKLPEELWLSIATQVVVLRDLSALARTSKNFYSALMPPLYSRAASSNAAHDALLWGVYNNYPRTVKEALAAGISPEFSILRLDRAPAKLTRHDLLSSRLALRKPLGRNNTNRFYWFPIHIAARSGNVDILDMLLSYGAKLTEGCRGVCGCNSRTRMIGGGEYIDADLPNATPDDGGWTALHLALCSGQIPAAELLLSKGASRAMRYSPQEESRRQTPWRDMSLLHAACISGQPSVVTWLIETGHDTGIDTEDSLGHSPLVCAYLYSNWACFDILLTAGANINALTSFEMRAGIHEDSNHVERHTMFYDALFCGRFKDAQHLIRLGADTTILSLRQKNFLLYQLCRKLGTGPKTEHEDGMLLLDHFLDLGLDPNRCSLGSGPLGVAAESGDLFVVKRLLRAGAHVDGAQNWLISPLSWAGGKANLPSGRAVVRLLLESGASIHSTTLISAPPLWHLNYWTQSDEGKGLFELFLARGASPFRGTSGKDIDGASPMENLLHHDDLEQFESLLDRFGTELMGDDDFLGFWKYLNRDTKPDLIRRIIIMDSKGVIARDNDNNCIRSLLKLKPPLPDVIARLLEQGASPNTANGDRPMLVYAIEEDVGLDIFRQLIAKGADTRRKWLKMTLLTCLLTEFMDKERTTTADYIRELVVAGVSPYQGIKQPSWGNPPVGVRPTHLSLAMYGESERYAEVVEIMLENQPLRNHPRVDVYEYLQLACRWGHIRALRAILKSTEDAMSIIRETSTSLLHHLLDSLFTGSRNNLGDVHKKVDCMQLLLQDGGADILAPAPAESPADLTAKEKILKEFNTSMEPMNMSKGVRYCFRQRMKFSDDAAAIIFLPWKPEDSFHLLSTSLVNLSKVIIE